MFNSVNAKMDEASFECEVSTVAIEALSTLLGKGANADLNKTTHKI